MELDSSWIEADVLHYGPRPHAAADRPRYLLLPAWVCRVHARRRQADPLNPLQRAVLGLCAAGVRTLDEAGTRLGLHRQLVGFIALQLDDRGLLDRSRLSPTAKGQEVLAGASAVADEAVVAHVFQDAWTGDLLSSCPMALARCDAARHGERTFRLAIGSRGEPRVERALVLAPPGLTVPPSSPEPARLIPLLRAALRAGPLLRDSGDEARVAPGLRPQIAQVSVIDAPRPVLLATCAYAPHAAEDGAGWFIADPFGGPPDARLRRMVQERLHEDRRLADWLDPVLARGAAHGDGSAGAEPLTAARWAVAERLGPRVPGGADVADAVAAMEHVYARERRRDARTLREGLAAVRDRGVHALAELLRAIARDFPTDGLGLALPQRDREHRDALIRQAAAAIGAAELPPALLQVRPDELVEACDAHEGTLQALLLGTVLMAARDPAHPMHAALAAAPDLLLQFVTCARRPDALPEPGPQSSREELEGVRRTVYTVVAAFVPWAEPAPASSAS